MHAAKAQSGVGRILIISRSRVQIPLAVPKKIFKIITDKVGRSNLSVLYSLGILI